MLIDNIDIKNFNARILEVDIQNSSFSNTPEWIEKALLPYFTSSKVNLNSITVNLLIDSKDKHGSYLDRSNLLKLMVQSFDLYFKDRNLQFKAVLANQQFKYGTKGIKGTLQLNFYAYCYENERIESLNKITNKSLTIVGNLDTPCVVEITPIVDIIDIKLEGLADDPIIIKNLQKDKTVILDGESGLVTVDGINKFSDTDFWEFPKLTPGTNNIKVSRSDCNIKIKYKPRYI